MGTALLLSLSVSLTGCVTMEPMSGDHVASVPNPLRHASYTEADDVEFVGAAGKGSGQRKGKVDFGSESASRRTRDMAEWVLRSGDSANMPFAIVDKVNAKVFVFNAKGEFYGAAPVLLGLAKGDHSLPGIGDIPMSRIPPDQRTTPAGRFVSVMGQNHKGKDILWLDYDQALSMHAVVRGTARDRRAERLASPTSADNRISFGCINVPGEFFQELIQGKFTGAGGVVYILPEMGKPVIET